MLPQRPRLAPAWRLLAALLLGGCAAPAAPQPAAPGPARAAMACPGLPDDTNMPAPPAPDSAYDDAGERAGNQEPATMFKPTQPLSYDVASNTIVLGAGAPASLPALARALARPDLLRAPAPGEWLLLANLWIGKHVAFGVAAPEARRLKLRTDAQGYVWIKTYGGQLTFDGACVTSWDPTRGAVATDYEHGRSFVLARDGARMDIRDSELSYLGFLANESYGVAWRQAGTSGSAINSRFGHNFYGLYSYEAAGLVIRGNDVHHSARYGIDPHTRSNNLLIEQNTAHHNGKQGIILAEDCVGSTIRNNIVYANSLHGIVLYQRSNNNLVEANTAYANALHGINLNDASDNTIRGNTSYGNGEAGIGIGHASAGNLVLGNTVRDNTGDGIYMFGEAVRNTVRGNIVRGNTRYGIYIKSPGNILGENQASGNRGGDTRDIR